MRTKRSVLSSCVVPFVSVVVSLASTAHAVDADRASSIDWSQPPAACVEEIVPRKPNRCVDLSGVADPVKDWPEDLPAEELDYWQRNRRLTEYCRSEEIMRREQEKPGSFSAGTIQTSWMRLRASENRDLKVKAIYEASRRYQIPGQILSGALMQESLLSELGMAEDGGNYSCGIGQVNVVEWCHWANAQPETKRKAMNWPQGVQCTSLQTSLVKPFYEIAKTKLNNEPEYKLNKKHFSGIQLKDVIGQFPQAPDATQRQRYQVVRSFLANCTAISDGISAKASELRSLYTRYIPEALKERDLYPQSKNGRSSYSRQCQQEGYTKAYPLHLGWLFAVGMYNAGPRALDALAHYYGWDKSDLENPVSWRDLEPKDLVEAIYWSGRYNPSNDRIEFLTLSNRPSGWIWFKACVLQRHLARVVQHATLPGTPKLVDTLEGNFKCAKSQFDPKTGELVKTAVPPHRQTSSGQVQREKL